MEKINSELSSKVLTIGCDYKNPKGGVAQVLKNYSNIYEIFNFIPTTKASSKVSNFITLGKALFNFLTNLLFNKNIEIIHIHGASYNSFYRKRIFINIAKFFHKKVIYHIHGAEFKNFTELNKEQVIKTLNKCDAIIALSESWKSYFNSLGYNNLTIIPNIINYPNLEYKKNSSKINLLFLGILGERKGIFDILEVFKINHETYKNKLHLYVGGNGESEKVKSYIRDNNLNDIITFCGWVSGTKKIELLNNCNLYILPSYNEGLPISILEAMSYSMPIISTNVGGIPEIVNEENGILIQPGDKKALQKAIKYFFDNPREIKVKGETSKSKVIKHFPDNVARELSSIYSNLL